MKNQESENARLSLTLVSLMIYSNWYSNSIPTPSMVQWTIAGWVVNWRVQWFPGDADQFSPALRLYYSNSTRRRRSLDTLPLTQWGWTLAWDIYHQLIKTSPPLSQPCVGSREVYLCFEKYQKNISTNQIKQGSDPSPPAARAWWKRGVRKNYFYMSMFLRLQNE